MRSVKYLLAIVLVTIVGVTNAQTVEYKFIPAPDSAYDQQGSIVIKKEAFDARYVGNPDFRGATFWHEVWVGGEMSTENSWAVISESGLEFVSGNLRFYLRTDQSILTYWLLSPGEAGDHFQTGVFYPQDFYEGWGSWQLDSTPRFICEGFAPPFEGSVVVKKNRVLPLKIELMDSDGNNRSDLNITAPPLIQVKYWSGSGIFNLVDVSDHALPVGLGTDGNEFEYTGAGVWNFNLQTKNYTAKGSYLVSVESGDQSKYKIDPDFPCEVWFIIN